MTGITDPSEVYFKNGLWGWFNSAWRKLPMLFGVTAPIALIGSNSNLSAGYNAFNSGVVPSGYIYVITNITIMYTGTAPNVLGVGANISTAGYMLRNWQTIVSAVYFGDTFNVVLAAGDYLTGFVWGATATDSCVLRSVGYSMAVS